MRTKTVLILAMLVLASGCQQTPLQKAALAEQGYTLVLNDLTAARKAGLIDDPTALKIEGIRKAVASALDGWIAAAAKGDDSWKQAQSAFNEAWPRMLEAWGQFRQKKGQ